MQTEHQPPGDLSAARRALLGFSLLEIALVMVAIGWQKGAGPAMYGSRAGAVLLAGTLLALGTLIALVRTYHASTAAARRAFRTAATVNVLALAVALAGAELLLRWTAVASQGGLALGSVTVPPTWNEMRERNRALLAGVEGTREHWLSYVVPDADLGWTVGPNRGTPDGLYYSSVEGVRSAGPDVTFATRRPRLRMALVGDSHTFSMDGPFEDSWGHQLETRLGADVQVLNFGVDGYGIDQSWLRYRRDAREWRPDIVLFGFVQHDVQRTVAVYPFLSFGWDYPFAKPRFVVRSGDLLLLNTPLVSPSEIVSYASVAELPYASLDLGYQSADWRWRAGDPPLVLRLFATAFPRWQMPAPEVSPAAAVDISGRVLTVFLQQAARDGTAARILYFPSEGAGDFGRNVPDEQRTARRMLAGNGIEHLDLTACVATVPRPERLVPGLTHYTRRANGAVARCVAEDLDRRGWLGPAAGAASSRATNWPREDTGAGGGT